MGIHTTHEFFKKAQTVLQISLVVVPCMDYKCLICFSPFGLWQKFVCFPSNGIQHTFNATLFCIRNFSCKTGFPQTCIHVKKGIPPNYESVRNTWKYMKFKIYVLEVTSTNIICIIIYDARNVSMPYRHHENIDGWVKDCSISSASAMEILQSCTKPSI